jgi:predicted Zn-dependent protease with MMP-like domain
METLPEPFRPFLKNLVVDVEDYPSRKVLKKYWDYTDEEIDAGEMPYGFFEAFPYQKDCESDKEVIDDEFEHPLHRIVIYKWPLEEDFPDPNELRLEIRKTVIHELAHHFGYSERDLEPFEGKADPFGDAATEGRA